MVGPTLIPIPDGSAPKPPRAAASPPSLTGGVAGAAFTKVGRGRTGILDPWREGVPGVGAAEEEGLSWNQERTYGR